MTLEAHLILMPKAVQGLLLTCAHAVEAHEGNSQVAWKSARADGALLGYGLAVPELTASIDALRLIAVIFIGADRPRAMSAAMAVIEAMKMVADDGAEVGKNSAADDKNAPGKIDFEGVASPPERNSAPMPTTVPDWKIDPAEPRKLAPASTREERERQFRAARARLENRDR